MDRAMDRSCSFTSQSITNKLGQRVRCPINTACFTAIVSSGLVLSWWIPPLLFSPPRSRKCVTRRSFDTSPAIFRLPVLHGSRNSLR